MTQDEIIEMARQADLHLYVHDITAKPYAEIVVAFANLVAAKAFQSGYEKSIAGFNAAVSLEREACAKIAGQSFGVIGSTIALAIRARGEQA